MCIIAVSIASYTLVPYENAYHDKDFLLLFQFSKRYQSEIKDFFFFFIGFTEIDVNVTCQHSGFLHCFLFFSFTEIDVNVTCRHLGFLKGNFTYHSFSRNLTDYMLWERPGCTGNENSLFNCPGVSKIRVGAHICGMYVLAGM